MSGQTLFSEATNDQAYLKAGFLGFQGGGKTFTASSLVVGLALYIQKVMKLPAPPPVYFMDSETGSSWVKPLFDHAGVKLYTRKTKTFKDLVDGLRQAERDGAIFLADSLSHFWRELCDSYAQKKKRSYLTMKDWQYLKGPDAWGAFSELYVNSKCHVVICGRAGFEYDMEENDDGKKELIKTGIKMKTEGEFGFEPSLLVLMSRHVETKTELDDKEARVTRHAEILKDRSQQLEGKVLVQPTFESFIPHIKCLNIGGTHVGVQAGSSAGMFDGNGEGDGARYMREKEAVLDEIGEVIREYHAGQSVQDKTKRGDLMEQFFGTRSWKRIEMLDLDVLKKGRNGLWKELKGKEYAFTPPEDDDVPGAVTVKGAAADPEVRDKVQAATGQRPPGTTDQSPDEAADASGEDDVI